MPIEDHFRWPVERRVSGDHDRGDVFEATWFGWTVHGFTHMDNPRHCVPGGLTTRRHPARADGRGGGCDRPDADPAADGAPARVVALEQH
jgi:arylformamidase